MRKSRKPASLAELGPPLDETFSKFQPGADQSVIAGLVAKYRERYNEVGYAENKLYPGVAEVLQTLFERGVHLGVCTSKRKDCADKILSMFNLRHVFCFVDGGDIGIKKQEQLARLLHAGQIDRAALMIGDRAVDISSAKTNGLHSVGVLWGFGDMTELAQADAPVILNLPQDLLRLAG